MPASKDGQVQTDKSDGRKYITIQAASNGRKVYRKIYLRTKEADVARRRVRALIDVEGPEEARRIVAYLDSSRSSEVEKRRIAELTQTGPTIPSLDIEEARRELEGIVCDWGEYAPGQIDDEIIEEWRGAYSASEQREILIRLGVSEDFLAENPDIYTQLKPRARKINPHYKSRDGALRALMGLPADKPARTTRAHGPRLSACIDEFRIEQEQRGNTEKHIKERIRKFNSFVELLKDKHIRALTKPDFVKYADHVVTEYQNRSKKTIRDALKAVEDVLEAARARMDDGIFPVGLDGWLKVLKRERRKRVYKSPRKNRQPMPADVFRSLLDQANEWAEMDWRKYAESMPEPDHEDGRVRTLQRLRNLDYARNLKRTGMMTHSMLCLCANTGAIPIDFCRLRWDELVLDGTLPLFREDREKPAHLLGEDVARCCPLVPETVCSLKRWKRYRDAEIKEFGLEQPEHADFVYSNTERRPFDQQDSSGATKLLTKVRKAADCRDWEIRHLRNIGGTAARDHRFPEAMADAWLGHAAGGTNVFYTGEAKDDYLLPLVEVIGLAYF